MAAPSWVSVPVVCAEAGAARATRAKDARVREKALMVMARTTAIPGRCSHLAGCRGVSRRRAPLLEQPRQLTDRPDVPEVLLDQAHAELLLHLDDQLHQPEGLGHDVGQPGGVVHALD